MAGTDVRVKRSWPLFTHHTSPFQLEQAIFDNHADIVTDLATLRTGNSEFVYSAAWNPGSISDTEEAVTAVTVTGAALGDYVTAVSLAVDVVDLSLTAAVTATNEVTVSLGNNSGGAVNLASSTLRVRVASPGLVDATGDLVASSFTTPELDD